MLENNYCDPTAQKAYVDGVNGCMEHVAVVHEIIQHANLNHKTVQATWFDLMDAFGSVSHSLIPYVMTHYHISKTIIKYIASLYFKDKSSQKIGTQKYLNSLEAFFMVTHLVE